MLSRCLKPPAASTFGTCSCSFLPGSRTRILMRSFPLRCRDSWCGKCKRILAHTVEAMVGDKPARVNCKTCKSQHSYKPHPLDRSSQRARKRDGSDGQTSQPAKPPSNRYNSLLRANNTAVAETYSPQNRYEPGDVLETPHVRPWHYNGCERWNQDRGAVRERVENVDSWKTTLS